MEAFPETLFVLTPSGVMAIDLGDDLRYPTMQRAGTHSFDAFEGDERPSRSRTIELAS